MQKISPRVPLLAFAIAVTCMVAAGPVCSQENQKKAEKAGTVRLPEPKRKGSISLEETIQMRRCVRKYADKPLSLVQVSQLLWAANGVTGRDPRFRAAPSAGALHPLDFYVVAGQGSVLGLEAGVWHYGVKNHELSLVAPGDLREALCGVSLRQKHVKAAEINIVITVEYARTTKKYGSRGKRYAVLDAGFAAENLFLQVQSLGLSTCVVGAFKDGEVAEVLKLPPKRVPMLILTIGFPEK